MPLAARGRSPRRTRGPSPASRSSPRAPGREGVAQVVDDVAAAQDQHALVAQRRERAADGEVLRRREPRVDAELDHRDVGGRAQVQEHAPRAVVEAPVGVDGGAVARRRAPPRASRASGSPGAGYWTRYSASGKPPKSWMVSGRSLAVVKVPSTYQCAETARIALGTRQRPGRASPRPRLHGVVLDGVHGRAVAHEQDRHAPLVSRASRHDFLPLLRVVALRAVDTVERVEPFSAAVRIRRQARDARAAEGLLERREQRTFLEVRVLHELALERVARRGPAALFRLAQLPGEPPQRDVVAEREHDDRVGLGEPARQLGKEHLLLGAAVREDLPVPQREESRAAPLLPGARTARDLREPAGVLGREAPELRTEGHRRLLTRPSSRPAGWPAARSRCPRGRRRGRRRSQAPGSR